MSCLSCRFSAKTLSASLCRGSIGRSLPLPVVPRHRAHLALLLARLRSPPTTSLTTSHQETTATHGFSHQSRPRSAMSSNNDFSNASTGEKPADPYRAKNLDNPPLEEKIEALSSFISASKFGMMTTLSATSKLLVSRCMAVAGKESGGLDLIFHTNTETGKTNDLADDPSINISFLNATGEWASISGRSQILTDRDVVKKYYSPALKGWVGDLGDGKHDGGPDDPRIGVIKVEAKTVTYALARGNPVSRGIEMVQGAVTGSAPQVNKLREVTEDECKQWRASHP